MIVCIPSIRLLAFACDHGCNALADKLFSSTLDAHKLNEGANNAGLSLMHRAVRSGDIKLVDQLKNWAVKNW